MFVFNIIPVYFSRQKNKTFTQLLPVLLFSEFFFRNELMRCTFQDGLPAAPQNVNGCLTKTLQVANMFLNRKVYIVKEHVLILSSIYNKNTYKMKGWKKERIIRVLLNHPDGSLTMYRVAKEAETHHSWAIKVIKRLEKKNLLKGTKVIDPRGLFDHWVSIHKRPKHRDYNVRDPPQLLRQGGKKGLEYALTTYAAESSVQKYLFLSRYDLYIKDLDQWHELAIESGVRGGGNFRILYDADPHIFYGVHTTGLRLSHNKEKGPALTLGTLPVVSIPQLILDLMVEGGPCTEAAELLIKRHLERR